MEQIKKRFRPTLTAYRALEREVIDLKKRIVNAVHVAVSQGEVVSYAQYRELLAKNHALEKSNKLLEDEITRLRDRATQLLERNTKLHKELDAVKNRNLLQRIFNYGR